MILPNKFIAFHQSALAPISELLASLDDPKAPIELLEAVGRQGADITMFINALDVLFAIGSVTLVGGQLHRVD